MVLRLNFIFLHKPTYFSLWMAICNCVHGYKKSACDQAHDIWRLELGKVNHTTFFSETQIFVHTNNLRCSDETNVRTSQKTTYAQFKIYRTNFIDEIGPRIANREDLEQTASSKFWKVYHT